MLHAVIMAGGSGTRFWPESRAARPKQLLKLAGERTMIQVTVDRLAGLVPPERVLVVTGKALAAAVAEQLPQLDAASILAEPCRRDTAPCIALAALAVSRHDADATMVVLPSDHVIEPHAALHQAIGAAERLVGERAGRLVTFGIRPTYAAESFGYIERGEPVPTKSGEPAAFAVRRFHEKPDAARAAAYLASGDFYWNSGIFVWKASTILAALRQHQPKLLERLERIETAWGRDEYDDVLAREFAALEGVSIDYAVLEHADELVVVEAPFQWDDVGSWQALARLLGTDAEGNTLAGKYLALNTEGTIVRNTSETHLVVTLGLRDCLVVHTPDATLVANKHDEESIRQVVRLLQERGWQEYL